MMITKTLAEFIVSTDYPNIPESAIKKAKLCFTDFLGVALRGSETKSGAAVKDLMMDLMDKNPSKVSKASNTVSSTIIGQRKTDALSSSLANGIFAHSLDLDDGHRLAHLHPAACVIPAALSICEVQGKDGEEFLSAIVVGYEIAITLGMMVNPEHRNRGFHSTGTCGTIGAAAAASKALNLDEEETINALGLAGTQAAGILESDHSGSMGKHLHAGRAAQSGVLSALLAQKGFTGAQNILEGDEGFLKALAGIDANSITTPDMNKFRILEVYFKIYPVCRHLHSSIDALIHLLTAENQNNEDKLQVEEIQDIIVKTYKIAAEHDDYNPNSIEALKQSLPMSLAVAVIRRNLKLDDLSDKGSCDVFQDDIIQNIARKVSIEYDPDLDALYPDKRPSHVIIRTHNEVYEKKVDLAYGEPENPLKKSDITKKFQDLNPQVNPQVFEMIDDLESYKMDRFMNLLSSCL